MIPLHEIPRDPLDPSKTSPVRPEAPKIESKEKAESKDSDSVIRDLSQKMKSDAAGPTTPTAPLHKGRLIVVCGPSSVGKTTLTKALRKLDPGMIEENADVIGCKRMYKFMQDNYTKWGVTKEDWDNLHNVLVAGDDDYHSHILNAAENIDLCTFKREASPVACQRAADTAKALQLPVYKEAYEQPHDDVTLVMDTILDHLSRGHDAVFDCFIADKFEGHALSKQKESVKSVLVYCPFHTLTVLIAKRNQEARDQRKYTEIRASVHPLFQYAELFRKKGPTDTAEKIGTITREQVEKDFDENFNAWVKNEKERGVKSKEIEQKEKDGSIEKERAAGKADLLRAFGFEDTDESIDLVPRKKYDDCIDVTAFRDEVTIEERATINAKRILGLFPRIS